jgi:hypothetical protein
MNKKTSVIIAIVLIVLIGAGVYILTKGGGTNEAVIENQDPGSTVIVKSVSLKNGGFVAVHESAEGNPGRIIGESVYLESGTTENVIVNLSRPLVAGEELFVTFHEDNGDKEFTNADINNVVRDEQGNIVIVRFLVSGNASEAVAQ